MEKKIPETYLYNGVWPWCSFKRISWEDLPMIKYTLWESLSTGVGTKISSKTKRFIYRQISFNHEHRSTSNLLFFKHVTTSSVQDTVDTTNSNFRALRENFINRDKVEFDHFYTWISHWYTGSISLGPAVNRQAYKHRRVVGIIWPPPRWIASAWRVTS